MTAADFSNGIPEASIEKLRHDLLNPLNVLLGTTSALLGTDLTERQRTCVDACRSTAERLMEIVSRLELYQSQPVAEGRAHLVDLCSIAAARVDKPFDRGTLLDTIRRLTGRRRPHILLVDDAPEVATLVRTYLRDTPCELDVVGDGKSAIRQATSRHYDLVLMDVDLPGMDGATAAHAIRTADLARGASPTPIVALSAFGVGLPPLEVTEDRRSRPRQDETGASVDSDIAPLIAEFLDNRRSDVEVLRTLVDRSEFSRVQTLGHKMKGSGRGYGFETVSRIGAELEAAAAERNAAVVTRLIDELDAYLSRVAPMGT